MSKYKVVLGSLFGDEGKGVTVNWLSKQAIAQGESCAIVRYSNGPQSGHTVCEQGKRHVFSSFGSGTIVGCPTIYKSGVFLDPVCYINEYKVLASKFIVPKINVGPFSKIISPYDVIANRRDDVNMTHGSCGKGVYKAKTRPFIYYLHNLMGEGGDKTQDFFEVTSRFYNINRIPKLETMYKNAIQFVWAQYLLHKDIKESDYDTLIYEGTQGLLLDGEKGFLPHVTATSVIPDLESFPEGTEIYLVIRSYLTRHGNHGDEVKLQELPYKVKFDYTNTWNKYQGFFNKGVFNIDLLNEGFRRHSLDKFKNVKYNLVITHCDDILPGFEYINHGVVKQGNFNTFRSDIKNSSIIPINSIYTNFSEESNLIRTL